MTKKFIFQLVLCLACVLAAFTFAFSQTADSTDIPKLLQEVKLKSDENYRKVNSEIINYAYKLRQNWREADKQGRVKETSELYELFLPTKCPIKKCRAVFVLLEKNGKPLAAAKIEKQRAKASEKFQKWEADPQAQELTPIPSDKLFWMKFAYYIRRPNSKMYETVVRIDGQEILEKCEFFAPTSETVNGRETIGLSFRPRADAVFDPLTNYMPQTEGKIWIDAQEKVMIRAAVWEKGTKFAETTSDYLLAHAALARDMTRTAEGIWFDRFGRINGLNYPNLFAKMKGDYSLEFFDHHRFNTEIKDVEIQNPGERK